MELMLFAKEFLICFLMFIHILFIGKLVSEAPQEKKYFTMVVKVPKKVSSIVNTKLKTTKFQRQYANILGLIYHGFFTTLSIIVFTVFLTQVFYDYEKLKFYRIIWYLIAIFVGHMFLIVKIIMYSIKEAHYKRTHKY
ncbi:MAG: hypothetical protein J6K88_06655 [Oscillospiraceae bacterium]|nr:hypothetical protein [Oscillospiraceae bacterium]